MIRPFRPRRRFGAGSRPAARPAIAFAALLLAAGCSFAPPPRQPVPVRDLPDEWPASAVRGDSTAPADSAAPADTAARAAADSATGPTRWWEAFGDPVLVALVDTALAANLDLREAVARVAETRRLYRIARADLFPTLDLTAEASRTRTPGNIGFTGQFGDGTDDGDGGDGQLPEGLPSFPDRLDIENWTVGGNFVYELDFWGRARNDARAAVHDFLASAADFRTARISVVSTTIATYLEIVELRRRVELARLDVELLAERLELTRERYARGLVTSFELYSIESQFRSRQSSIPVLESSLTDAEGRLAVLLGRPAGEIGPLLAGAAAVEILPDPVPAGLPASLLDGRPDVEAAWLRLEASRFRTGARRAELFPQVRLAASAGFQSSSLSDLFRADQWFVTLLGGLTQPLFQGGRLRASAGAAEASYLAAAAGYARAALTAHQEVVSSLRDLEKQAERHAFLREQRSAARGSVDYQIASFSRGVGDYLQYLDARRNLVTVETELAAAGRALAGARVALHRALGGAWVGDEEMIEDRLEEDYGRMKETLMGEETGR